MKKLLFPLAAAALLCACATAPRTTVTVPDTPDGLLAYSECQKIHSVKTGMDQQGYCDLMRNCMNTAVGSKMGAEPAPAGCRVLQEADDCDIVYLACPGSDSDEPTPQP